MSRNALGRGLSALIREPEPSVSAAANLPSPQPAAASPAVTDFVGVQTVSATPAARPEEGYVQIDIDLIDPSPYQPRTRFREEALEELARSLRSTGIVQPLIVRKQATAISSLPESVVGVPRSVAPSRKFQSSSATSAKPSRSK